MNLATGDRVEITTNVPYYIHLDHDWDPNTKLYLLLVGCRGTVRESFRTWDSVPYVRLTMDLDPEKPYTIGPEWCAPLSAIERLGELVA